MSKLVEEIGRRVFACVTNDDWRVEGNAVVKFARLHEAIASVLAAQPKPRLTANDCLRACLSCDGEEFQPMADLLNAALGADRRVEEQVSGEQREKRLVAFIISEAGLGSTPDGWATRRLAAFNESERGKIVK